MISIKVAILSTGEEIIEGEILNITAKKISQELYDMGFKVSSHVNVGDKKEDIILFLDFLSRENDIIFITGGLGSTRDDLTKEAMSDFLKENLIYNENIYKEILDKYKKYEKSSNELIKKQAYTFRNSMILKNEVGSAPGIYIIRNEKHYFLLPGPPIEALSIFSNYIKRILFKFNTKRKYIKKIQFYNITESNLMSMLREKLRDIKYSTKLELPIGPSIIFKDDKEKVDPIVKYIEKNFKKYIIPNNPIEKLIEILIQNKKTISIAESCTGGLVGDLITNVSGASNVFRGGVVSYSIFSKEKIIEIDPYFLKKHGTINSKTVEMMAKKVSEIFNSNYAVSISGIAGPNTDEFSTPVGTVFFGIYNRDDDKIIIENKIFSGNRRIIKEKAAYYVLIRLLKMLL